MLRDRLVPVSLALVLGASLVAAPAGVRPAQAQHEAMPPSHAQPGIPLLENLGSYHRAITTKSPEAQRYFDQGLNLLFAFAMEEAQRSFEEAARRDPDCAMCQWGVAMSLGPHINFPAIPERTRGAFEAERRALVLHSTSSPIEQALIEALEKRYRDPQPSDPKEELAAETEYANAMREVMKRFPEDVDAAYLFCEAMMDLRPWDYWTKDGTPQPGTDEVVAVLEKTLAKDAMHPGVNHLYIHIVEASPHPEKAVAAADRLRKINSGAGHLTHMPSHIYQRIGRYPDAYEANRRAVEMDKLYFAKTHPQMFASMYSAHNSQFLSWTSMFEGRSMDAIRRGREAAERLSVDMARMMPGTDFMLTMPLMAMVKFEKWDDILQEQALPADLPYARAVWHHARGIALCAKGRLDEAAAARDSVDAIARAVPREALEDLNPTQALLGIASKVLGATLAEKKGDADDAIQALREAVAAEEALRYSEPADWLIPVRHQLGSVLLEVRRYAEAETIYREDLAANPENGWALYGLAESLRKQGKSAEATQVQKRFEKAWSRADIKLAAARP